MCNEFKLFEISRWNLLSYVYCEEMSAFQVFVRFNWKSLVVDDEAKRKYAQQR